MREPFWRKAVARARSEVAALARCIAVVDPRPRFTEMSAPQCFSGDAQKVYEAIVPFVYCPRWIGSTADRENVEERWRMLFRLEKLQENMEFSDQMVKDVLKRVLGERDWTGRNFDAEYWIEECARRVCALCRFFQQAKVEKVEWIWPLRCKARTDSDEAVRPVRRCEREVQAEADFWDSLIAELGENEDSLADEDCVAPERDAKIQRLQ